MAIDIPEPFSAAGGDTCSFTAAFQAQHVVKPEGMAEADWEKLKIQGEVGALLGKMDAKDLLTGTYFKNEAGETIQFDGFGFNYHNEHGEIIEPEINLDIPGSSGSDYMYIKIKENEMKKVGSPPPSVFAGSESPGHMTDEDISVLFVKTKDTAAELKGINIKAASPHIDDEVYEAISKVTGYTVDETKAKVAAYKASGKKLSVLKKKVMKDDSVYANALSKAQKKPAGPVVVHPAKAVPDVPESVPTVASPAAEKQAVGHVAQQVKEETYDEEDLVKAYIKAKDELAADPDNPFNLYSKGAKFDEALEEKYHGWGINVNAEQVDKAVANYVGSGKKVSALKKKMVNSGEMKAKAPTLKTPKTPVEKVEEQLHAMPPTKSETVVAHQIDEAVKLSDSLDQYVVDEIAEDKIFSELKDTIANYKSIDTNLKSFYENAKKNNLSMSYVVKAYDKKKAGQLGVENSNFYEKKLLDYLSTPSGKTAAENLGKPPPAPNYGYSSSWTPEPPKPNVYSTPLPPDSEAYDIIQPYDAVDMQKGLEQWTGSQKEAIQRYTGSSYRDINGQLRTGNGSRQDETIRQMDKGMRAMPKDILVHRGTTLENFGVDSEEELKTLLGGTVKEKGYLSTSVGGSAAFSSKPVIMEIEIPKGARAAYVDHISVCSGEKEMIIARGTEMRILSIDETGSGGYYGGKTMRVRLRIVSQEEDTYRDTQAARMAGERAAAIKTPLSEGEISDLIDIYDVHPGTPDWPDSHEAYEKLLNSVLEG
jgi:hypothetical protein